MTATAAASAPAPSSARAGVSRAAESGGSRRTSCHASTTAAPFSEVPARAQQAHGADRVDGDGRHVQRERRVPRGAGENQRGQTGAHRLARAPAPDEEHGEGEIRRERQRRDRNSREGRIGAREDDVAVHAAADVAEARVLAARRVQLQVDVEHYDAERRIDAQDCEQGALYRRASVRRRRGLPPWRRLAGGAAPRVAAPRRCLARHEPRILSAG